MPTTKLSKTPHVFVERMDEYIYTLYVGIFAMLVTDKRLIS
jgi:hypothetical protein